MAGLAELVHTSSTIWVDPLAILAMVSSIGLMLIAVMRPVRKRGKQLDLFLRDWTGEPERPGVIRRAGVMERLSKLEAQGLTQGSQLDVIHAEVNFNHGGSIKDAVTRVDHRVADVSMHLEGVETDVRFLKQQNTEKLLRLDKIDTTMSDLHGQYVHRMEGVDADLKSLHDNTHISVDVTRGDTDVHQ